MKTNRELLGDIVASCRNVGVELVRCILLNPTTFFWCGDIFSIRGQFQFLARSACPALEGLSANASQNSMPKIWPDHGAQTQHGPHPTEGHHTRGHHVERHTCSPDIHLPQLSEKELFVAALDGCHIPVQLCQTLFR